MFSTYIKVGFLSKGWFILLLLGSMVPGEIWAQCRDTDAWASAWESCQTAPSPNVDRADSHWLLYDLGHVYALGDMSIWNANQQGQTAKGIKRAVLDYSLDGQTWTEWGNFELNQASGLPYYGGERAAQLQALQARYVLLTVLETWGDPACASIHELSFKVEQRAILPDNSSIWAYPNPTQDEVNITMELPVSQRVTIEVLDVMGRRISRDTPFLDGGRVSVPYSFGRLGPGAYVVRVLRGDNELVGITKVLVQ